VKSDGERTMRWFLPFKGRGKPSKRGEGNISLANLALEKTVLLRMNGGDATAHPEGSLVEKEGIRPPSLEKGKSFRYTGARTRRPILGT